MTELEKLKESVKFLDKKGTRLFIIPHGGHRIDVREILKELDDLNI